MKAKFADINIEALNCVVTIAWINDHIDSWGVEKVVQTYDDQVFVDEEDANDVVEFFIGWSLLEREVKKYFEANKMVA